MGKIIQILAPFKEDDNAILYGLDEYGQVWYLTYQLGGYAWTKINAAAKQ